MGEFITKEKMTEILSSAPPETDKAKMLTALSQKGYEIEGYNAQFSPFETLKNVPGSTLEFGKAIWTAVTNPVESVKGISSLGRGSIRKAYQGITGKEMPVGAGPGMAATGTPEDDMIFDAMVGFFVERYGSKDKLLNTIEKDPAGFLADAATVMGGASLPLKTASTTGKLGMLRKTGDVLSKYSRALEPTTLAIKTARKFNDLSGVNNLMRRSSAKFMAKATDLKGSPGKNIAKTAKLPEKTMEIEGRTVTLYKKPEVWLAERGIHGSIEDMHKQVSKIEFKTVDVVDNLLGSVKDTYKTDSATKFLTELRNAYGKTIDDVVEGVDTVKLFDAKGKAISKQIPYKQKEPIFVPMENMPKDMQQSLGEIQDLLQKSKTTGLSLTELNKTKRLADQILNIYDRSGDVKAGMTAAKLSGLRSEIRKFIEVEADKKGIPDIKELNKQSQMALLIKNHFDDILTTTEGRSAIGDQLIFMMGLTGTVATGGGAPLLGAATVVGGREIVRVPRVRSFISNRLRLMADSEFEPLLRGVETGKFSKKAGQVVRELRRDLQKAFPELRLTGITQEQMEKIPIQLQQFQAGQPIFQTTETDQTRVQQ